MKLQTDPALPTPARLEPLEGRLLLHADDNPIGTGLLGEYFSTADQSTLVFARPDPASQPTINPVAHPEG